MEDLKLQQFLKVYDADSDAVFRLCFFSTTNREVAIDLTQDAFTKTWDAMRKGVEIRNIRAYVFHVARNLIKDHWKKKKTVEMNEGEKENSINNLVDTLSTDTETKAEASRVLDVLENFPENERTLIHLRYIEGYRPKDIAQLLGERENTISVRLNRSMEKLRQATSSIES